MDIAFIASNAFLADAASGTGPAQALVTAIAVGVAAAVLSVFVVLRRWAYMGEGISHAGFGGVGTALLLSIAIPSLNNAAMIYLIAAIFALATAMAVAWLSRSRAVSVDSAIGIFVAATLAWGLIAFAIHNRFNRGGSSGWDNYLFGDVSQMSSASMVLGLCMSAAVVLIVIALNRQIILYCFDPMLAEVTGVPVAFIHYLLILLVGIVIIIGMRLAGNLLVPALLVLPGATGLALSRKLRSVMGIAIVASLVATIAGFYASHRWIFLPSGAPIVLVMFVEFLVAHGIRDYLRRPEMS
jgi:ABC-type Mn2+/Zn2+ transport system permease subunit